MTADRPVTKPRHERGYIPLIDNRLRCKACEEPWPCAKAAQGAAPLTRDDRTNAKLPPSAPDEVVRWMRNNDLVAVTRRAYDDVRWGAAPTAAELRIAYNTGRSHGYDHGRSEGTTPRAEGPSRAKLRYDAISAANDKWPNPTRHSTTLRRGFIEGYITALAAPRAEGLEPRFTAAQWADLFDAHCDSCMKNHRNPAAIRECFARLSRPSDD